MLVLERALDGTRHERATAPRADAPIEILDELFPERYVYTHGHMLAH